MSGSVQQGRIRSGFLAAAASLSLMVLSSGCSTTAVIDGAKPTAETLETKKQLLEMTGGRRVKVVWNQNADKDQKLCLFDTKDAAIHELPFCGSSPLLSKDGRCVFASVGKAPDERAVKMFDTKTATVTELSKGPANNLLAVWTDPKTSRTWVFVNASGDKNEAWNDAKGGPIYRYPVDNPSARELFWDRTSSHFYLMFSEDGTRACLEPSWANIGQLKLAFTADGKVDQDKSVFKAFGGGCFPSMAPDNSYRLFRLDGDHSSVTMCDADNANPRKVPTLDMLKERNIPGNCWLTRWSTDARYISLIAPAGDKARIWLGRLDEGATKFEKWVPVSPDGGKQCWQSQAWIEPGKSKK